MPCGLPDRATVYGNRVFPDSLSVRAARCLAERGRNPDTVVDVARDHVAVSVGRPPDRGGRAYRPDAVAAVARGHLAGRVDPDVIRPDRDLFRVDHGDAVAAEMIDRQAGDRAAVRVGREGQPG